MINLETGDVTALMFYKFGSSPGSLLVCLGCKQLTGSGNRINPWYLRADGLGPCLHIRLYLGSCKHNAQDPSPRESDSSVVGSRHGYFVLRAPQLILTCSKD